MAYIGSENDAGTKSQRLPEAISFDEFKGNTGGQRFQCIVTDPLNHSVFDILPARTVGTIQDYLLTFPNRDEVKYVVMDTNRGFRDAAKAFLPNAQIIIGRFHVARFCTGAMDNIRRSFQSVLPNNQRKHFKVSYDYLVSDGRNKYSVPYDLIGQTVDLRQTRNLVEVFYHGSRVAVHVRLASAQRDPVVKPVHMPETHRKYLGYNEHEFTTWAAGICPKTLDVVRHFLTSGKEVEQGYKAYASLTKLANRYGAVRLENACARVPDLSSAPTIRNISALYKAATERKLEGSDLPVECFCPENLRKN